MGVMSVLTVHRDGQVMSRAIGGWILHKPSQAVLV